MVKLLKNFVCGVYIRKSRKDKDKANYRLEVQRDVLPEEARKNGWEVRTYDEGHASAAQGKTEKLVQRRLLEDDIRKGAIHIVLAIELSRLSRDKSLMDYLAFITLCAEHDVKLATPGRALHLRNHGDWFLALLEGGFSATEIRQTTDRMKEGRREAYEQGAFLGGKPPTPYRVTNKKLVFDVGDRERVVRMLTRMTEVSVLDVAKEFGIPYASARRIGTPERLDFLLARRPSIEHPGEWITCDWAPAISEELAREVILARKHRNARGGNDTKPGKLLTGLGIFRCGYCGHSVKSWRNKHKRTGASRDYYYCSVRSAKGVCRDSRMFSQRQVEAGLGKSLLRILGAPERLRDWAEREREEDAVAQQLAALEGELAAREREKQRLVDAVALGAMDLEEVALKMAALRASVSDLAGRIAEARKQVVEATDLKTLPDVPVLWRAMTLAERREVVHAAIEEIRLYETYMIVRYRFPVRDDLQRETRIHLPRLRAGRPARGTRRNDGRRSRRGSCDSEAG